ncbi:MAG: T9SS type A sorting domain-containing protein, partial [Flavobacteriales bacterium]|nr:T9SS type A sorting domain-containing protein [Flavobacteriales bacterium]
GPSEEFTEIVVERFLEDGSVDPTFGGDGSVLVYIGDATGEQLRGAVLGDDGGIYFCGFAYASGETEQSLLLGHVDANGNSPSTFGNANGHSLVSLTGIDVLGRTIAAMPDGGFAVAGVERAAGASQARMIFTFDATGNMAFNSAYDDPAGADAWNTLLVQNNGSIISGGNVADGPGFRNWNVERQYADLDMDPSFDAVDYDEGDGLETCFDLEFFGDSSILGIGTAELSGGATYIVLLKYLNDISSSINDGEPGSWATVFPNPVTDRTMLTFAPSSIRMVSLSLMDEQGRRVRSWSHTTTGNGTVELDLSGLAPGIYSLRTNNLASKAALKIVKQ